jgi:hypothetical protein
MSRKDAGDRPREGKRTEGIEMLDGLPPHGSITGGPGSAPNEPRPPRCSDFWNALKALASGGATLV